MKPKKIVKRLSAQANIGSRLIGKGNNRIGYLLGGKMVRGVLQKVTGRKQLGNAVAGKIHNPLTRQTVSLFSKIPSSERKVVEAILSKPNVISAVNLANALRDEMKKSKDPAIRRLLLVERGARGINTRLVARGYIQAFNRMRQAVATGEKFSAEAKAKRIEAFRTEKNDFKIRVAVQNALDLAGVVDKEKREEVLNLVRQVDQRAVQRNQYGKKLSDDPYTINLTNQIFQKFDSLNEAKIFLGNYTRNIQLVDTLMDLAQEVAYAKL